MTPNSDLFNRIASEGYDPEEIQKQIKTQKQEQESAGTGDFSQPEGLSAPYVAPSTPTEEWLAETVEEWLELERVGINDDFFELGGDSIKALRILSRARDKFQVDVPQSILFSVQFTVAELAKIIDQYQIESASADELAALMDELGDLSDEEVQAQLHNDD